jgi:hypothetical protein
LLAQSQFFGEMAEWSIASDLKSDELTGSVSSNLTLSYSTKLIRKMKNTALFVKKIFSKRGRRVFFILDKKTPTNFFSRNRIGVLD